MSLCYSYSNVLHQIRLQLNRFYCFLASCVIHGHRGARGLAPENTMVGFARAWQVGVDGIELDVVISADDRVVIHHDLRLNKAQCRDQSGNWIASDGPRIRELLSTDLSDYDIGRAKPGSETDQHFPQQSPTDGESIPLLDELAAWWHDLGESRPILNIELKSHPDYPDDTPPLKDYSRIIVDELNRLDLIGYTWLQAFDWRLLQLIQNACSEIPTGYLSCFRDGETTIYPGGVSPWLAGFDPDRFGGSTPRAVHAAGGTFWGPWFGDLDPTVIQEAKTLGLPIHTWTVNESEDIIQALDWGIDGITTDYPDRARRLVRARHPAPKKTGSFKAKHRVPQRA